MKDVFFGIFLVVGVVGVVMFTVVAVGVNRFVRKNGAVPWRLFLVGLGLMVVGILGAFLLRPADDSAAASPHTESPHSTSAIAAGLLTEEAAR